MGQSGGDCLREREQESVARKGVEAPSGRTESTGPATGTE